VYSVYIICDLSFPRMKKYTVYSIYSMITLANATIARTSCDVGVEKSDAVKRSHDYSRRNSLAINLLTCLACTAHT